MVSFLNNFVYFQKCMYVFIVHSILATTQDFFLWVVDGGVMATEPTARESGDMVVCERLYSEC
jgi:hypothetical protein